jgi:CP family cyanate transporter-like MFS transporter
MGVRAPAPQVSRRYGTWLRSPSAWLIGAASGRTRCGGCAPADVRGRRHLGPGKFTRASITSELVFEDCELPADAILPLSKNIGSALSSVFAVPISDATGSWRWSLVVFSALTVALVPVWMWLTRGEPPHERPTAARIRLPFHSGTAWVLVGIFGSMACVFYGLNSWLPDVYVERGWSDGKAGGLLAVLNIAALVTTVIIPWLSDRKGSRRVYLVSFSAALALAVAGFVVLPGGAWAWATVVGLATGAMFPLVMTLPSDVGRRATDVASVTGLMLGVGYMLGAVAPLLLGAARDLTGTFTTTLWLIAGSGAVLFSLCASMTPERIARGVVTPEPA